MIRAELQGKYVREALNSEDYLTSNVFSVLRFQPLHSFWFPLLGLTRNADKPTLSLLQQMHKNGISPAKYDTCKLRFWVQTAYGEPDLELTIQGPNEPDIRILIEAKYLSGKSSINCEDDQLRRYLSVLLDDADHGRRPDSHSALIYLTVRSAQDEVKETLECFAGDALRLRKSRASSMFYTLHWPDISEAVRLCLKEHNFKDVGDPAKVMLRELLEYLQMRDLESFRGMRTPDWRFHTIRCLMSRPLLTYLPDLDIFPVQTLMEAGL